LKIHAAISILGKDRPGIVSAATKILYECGCNIEDSSMTQLANEFAMILIVEAPDKDRFQELKNALAGRLKALQLTFSLRKLSQKETSRQKPSGKSYTLSVYGADKPGIVLNVSGLLAKQKINITDVQTKIVTGREGKVYIMFIEINTPKNITEKLLKQKMKQLSSELNVNIAVNPVESPRL
jgi:glycine cleavage system transcriptional repressor